MSRALTRVATVGLTGLVSALLTTVLTTVLTIVLTTAPAIADDPVGPKEGADPGKGLSPGATILLYVILPLAVVAIIAAMVWLPGAVNANRYRPNKGWTARPVWFAGPADPVAAVQSAEVGDVVRGGASGSW